MKITPYTKRIIVGAIWTITGIVVLGWAFGNIAEDKAMTIVTMALSFLFTSFKGD